MQDFKELLTEGSQHEDPEPFQDTTLASTAKCWSDLNSQKHV